MKHELVFYSEFMPGLFGVRMEDLDYKKEDLYENIKSAIRLPEHDAYQIYQQQGSNMHLVFLSLTKRSDIRE